MYFIFIHEQVMLSFRYHLYNIFEHFEKFQRIEGAFLFLYFFNFRFAVENILFVLIFFLI